MKPTRSVFFSMLVAACISAPAIAALGSDAASVEADGVHLKGAVRVTPGVSYSMHEISLPSGTVVHEYLSPAGKVFGVTWQGPRIPDLRQLLGAFSSQLAAAANQPHYNHRHLSVQTPDVVFESSGRMSRFVGRAWVPALVPLDFSLSDLH